MASNKPYKRATSLQSLFRKHIIVLFFSYIYKIFNDTNEPDVDTDIPVALSYDPSKMINIKGAVEKFAEYIVDNFLLPRTSIFRFQLFRFYC
ncbi:uncharacterized protein EURHEDRAFT_417721 [Aspergillus ruber CBS 135680]|uniref:Uncharacterized protein n=1 Tax=Aspergillus ruber (strain CBS 135680) TaxID=1388766 RepID=A0A017RZG2_ASPRC|nr:uncharacterized protein EURHEDRAFT_417721 [Aspergillus ruber CBS 135680]EYE90168.1 hypothetical protein EURHEDRAFT_417721 [Aspergillus ruber CBS 135680]